MTDTDKALSPELVEKVAQAYAEQHGHDWADMDNPLRAVWITETKLFFTAALPILERDEVKTGLKAAVEILESWRKSDYSEECNTMLDSIISEIEIIHGLDLDGER